MNDTRPCGLCPARIMYATTQDNHKPMPLDPDPDPAGNVAAYKDGTGRLIARVLRKGEKPQGYERLYMPHFATCPGWQRRRQAPAAKRSSSGGGAQVIDLDSYREQADGVTDFYALLIAVGVAFVLLVVTGTVLAALGVLKVELKRPPKQVAKTTRSTKANGPSSGGPVTMPPPPPSPQ